MAPARILTDAGGAFIKCLGNPQGPHALSRELVGTVLARWFGLQTLDHALMTLTPADEIQIGSGKLALPGPALVTRAERGHTWGGDAGSLDMVSNSDDITRMPPHAARPARPYFRGSTMNTSCVAPFASASARSVAWLM